jgi:hypothetical protein
MKRKEKLQTGKQKSIATSYTIALEFACTKKCFPDGDDPECAIKMVKAFENKNAMECFEIAMTRYCQP